MIQFQLFILSILISVGITLSVLLGTGFHRSAWQNVEHYVATQQAQETVTQTPIPTSTPVVYHRVTHYDAAWDGGLLGCGSDIYGLYDHLDPTTAASRSLPCGTRVRVCADACQVVIVKDHCGACGLDLSTAAWKAIGEPDFATLDVLPSK